MWLLQIIVASFWLYMGTCLLYREAMFWNSVKNIAWFRDYFGGSTSRRWERFAHDSGILCIVVSFMLFMTLPYGVGVLGAMVAYPAMILMAL